MPLLPCCAPPPCLLCSPWHISAVQKESKEALHKSEHAMVAKMEEVQGCAAALQHDYDKEKGIHQAEGRAMKEHIAKVEGVRGLPGVAPPPVCWCSWVPLSRTPSCPTRLPPVRGFRISVQRGLSRARLAGHGPVATPVAGTSRRAGHSSRPCGVRGHLVEGGGWVSATLSSSLVVGLVGRKAC